MSQKKIQTGLQQKNCQHGKDEMPLPRLVPENIHAKDTAYAASDERNNK